MDEGVMKKKIRLAMWGPKVEDTQEYRRHLLVEFEFVKLCW